MKAVKDFLGAHNRIGRRLIVLTVAFSSVITLVISALQLLSEYRELRSDLDRQLTQIEIYLPSIAGSVWAFDGQQIGLAVEALSRLPNVDQVAVTPAESGQRWAAGKGAAEHPLVRSYSLRHDVSGRSMEIGRLEVTASLDGIFQRVWSHAISIILSNGLKTFFVAIFMFVLFRRLVTNRLEALAGDIVKLVPQVPVSIPGKGERPHGLDELDTLRWALEDLGAQLGVAVDQLRHANDDLEERIQERTAALENANQDLQTFSYGLSHDLRAPLRSIAGFADILASEHGRQLDSDGSAMLNRIRAAARRMDALINDTLGLFKVSVAQVEPQKVDLAEVSRDVIRWLVEGQSGRQVNCDVAQHMEVNGDPALLRIALENLIGNAWKYTARNPAARIEVGMMQESAKATVYYVKDNGVGFDMAYAENLFQPFQRLHRESEFAGTGVGLAVVHRVIQRHGGRIWVEALPERGATFFFTLGQ